MNKKFEIDPLKVMIALLAVVLILAGGLFVLGKNPSKELLQSTQGNKNAGEQTISNVDKETKQAFYYPKFEDETLNRWVMQTVDEMKQPIKENELFILDYASDKVFDQYINLQFTANVYDQKRTLLDTKERRVAYDLINQKFLGIRDCLRSDYQTLIGTVFTTMPESIHIEADGIVGYDASNQPVGKLSYVGNERYIALRNDQIPSLAPKEIIQPLKQDIDPDKPMIVFTFDDGPTPEITERIMNAFLNVDGRATFFELGSRMEAYGELTKMLYENGFEIGNHSYTHTNLGIADEATIRDEIYRTQDQAYSLTGKEIELIRPTYGEVSDLMKEVIPYRMINWNIDSLDWQSRDVASIKNEVLPYIEDGSIILMHDLYESTAQAVEEMLPMLSKQGYQFVTLSDYLRLSGK